MLRILLSLVLWIPSVYGWAWPFAWIRRRFYQIEATEYQETEALLGLCVLATLASLLHLAVAISGLLATILLVSGWIWAVLRFRAEGKGQFSRPALAAGMVWLVVLALAAAQPPLNGDAGLYHLQSIAWLTDAPLAPGLGNLHGRLAFNSAWFSVAAAVEIPFISRNSAFVVSPLLLWFWGLAISRSVVNLVRGRAPGFPDLVMALSILAFYPRTGSASIDISTPSPDLPAIVLSVFLTYVFCRFLIQEKWRGYDFIILLSLATFATIIKLSALPLLLLPAAAFVMAMLQKQERFHWRTGVLLAGSISLAIFAIWLVTGFVLSGCWAYPVDLTCWPRMSWSVPHAVVINDYDWIRSWARWPGQLPKDVLANWNWFWVWLPVALQAPSFTLPLTLFVVGIAGQWVVSRWSSIRQTSAHLLLYALLGLGVLYWFLNAPTIRFGEGFFWSLAILSLGEWLAQLHQHATARVHGLRRLGPVVMAVLAVLIMLNFPAAQVAQLKSAPGPFLLAWPTMPAVATTTFHTDDGTVLYVPVGTDKCWLASLPCTPYPLKNLQLSPPLAGSRASFSVPPATSQ